MIIYGVQTSNFKEDKTFFISHCLGCGSINIFWEKLGTGIFIPHQEDAGQNFYIKTANRSVGNVAKLRYLVKVLTDESCMHGETKGDVTTRHTQHIFSVIEKAMCLVQPKHVAFWITINKCSVQKEIKSRLKLGNACYYSVQNLLSFRLLPKKLKIKIYIEL